MKEGFPIAGGSEKLIYEDPASPNRVIKKYREKETRETNLVRARFYLAKILHGVLPENFPDIHQSASQPNQVIMDRVIVDNDHAEIQKVLKSTSEQYVHLGALEREKFKQYRNERKADPRVIQLVQTLKEIGIDFDQASLNFSLEEDRAIYLDTIEPWGESIDRDDDNKSVLKKNFHPEKLRLAIQALPDSTEQHRLLGYHERLVDLYASEKTAFDEDKM
jgi:hypothetical protein